MPKPKRASSSDSRKQPRQKWAPGKADLRNQVIEGAARFTVLSPSLIRLEYAPKKKFEDRRSFFALHRDLPAQDFKVWRSKGMLQIETPLLRLSYKGGAFTAESLEITVMPKLGSRATWRPGMQPKANLGGTLRTLDECRWPLDLTIPRPSCSRMRRSPGPNPGR